MTGVIAVIPRFQFSSASGAPLVNGTVTTYLAGTTTPTPTWQDQALTILNANPVPLDSRGECVLWLDPTKAYKWLLKNAGGVSQWTEDNITGSDSSAIALAANLASKTDAAKGSGLSGHGVNLNYAAGTIGSVLNDVCQNIKMFPWLAKGDGVTDDTAAINAAFASGVGGFIVPPGVYIHSKLTVNTRITLWGVMAAEAGALVRPRFHLKSGTNDNLFYFTTAGAMDAHNIDFWGNKAGQSSGTSWGIYLQDDSSGSYVGANAVKLFNCLVRNCRSGGIYAGTNRNGGGLFNASYVSLCDGTGVELNGGDWGFAPGFQVGENTGSGIINNIDSNDFIGGDIYSNSLSGIVLGINVRVCPIIGNQINTNGRHGIDASACDNSAVRGIQIKSNTFINNSTSGTNTYSNIKVGACPGFAIGGNFHAAHGANKPKYLIEAVLPFPGALVAYNEKYTAASYGTADTNSKHEIGFQDDTQAVFPEGMAITARSSFSQIAYQSYIDSEANPRFYMTHGGTHNWGPGTGATDVTLGRLGVGVIGVINAGEALRTGRGATGTRPSAATVGSGGMWYDSTLDKPIWSDGANWRDAAGTLV